LKKDENRIDELLIFDAHCDTANVLLDQHFYFINRRESHLGIEKIKKGGLKAQIFAIWVNPIYPSFSSINKALLLYHVLEKEIFSRGYGRKVTSTIEMQSCLKDNKLACWISLEGGHIIDDSPEILDLFYYLGVRSMTLTHTKNTNWADSSSDKPKWDGLNKLGKKIITQMDKMRMAIDISHASDKCVEDVLDVTSMPIMASHSCARTLCNIPRNLPDDLIKEIADRKGYIGVAFYPGFLNKRIYNQLIKNYEKFKKEFEEKIEQNKNNPDIINQLEFEIYRKMIKGIDYVDLQSVIGHIVNIADIGGIDCVGLGSDFDGILLSPVDLKDVSCYPALVKGLFERGFKITEIRKIMGLNLFNFLKHFD
jgi:membrane dipeptidase